MRTPKSQQTIRPLGASVASGYGASRLERITVLCRAAAACGNRRPRWRLGCVATVLGPSPSARAVSLPKTEGVYGEHQEVPQN